MRDPENSPASISFQPLVHRAPWVVTDAYAGLSGVAADVIEDGALLVADGMIQSVGKYSEIAREFGQYPIKEHEGRVLVPALLNGHCHLELSYSGLAGKFENRNPYSNSPTTWIKDLLAEREKFAQQALNPEALINSHARKILHQFTEEGVAFVGDVGNSVASRSIGAEQDTPVYFLLELLGLTREAETKAFVRLDHIMSDDSLDIGCTPHAPYSTTPDLIKAIKKQAVRRNSIFSIHVAESEQEVEFLQSGTGAFREFLFERGAWDGSFAIPGMGSVRYLESLGVLDDKTLCVHAVHVDHEEIEILAQKKAKICLCPGSNRFLGVGKAPVTEFLARGMLPALGTDSKASNVVLSMWNEMRLLREDQPGLPPQAVFAMATRGGAESWGVASELGSLDEGKIARVLAVSCGEKIKTADIFEFLTSRGDSVRLEWME